MILLRRIQDLSDCVRQIPIKAFFQLVFLTVKNNGHKIKR